MFGSRGERPHSRPRSSRRLGKALACSAFSLFVCGARADVYSTRDSLDVNPLDWAITDARAPYQEGLTAGGLRYKVLRNEGASSYSGRYTSFHDSVRIEFDRPVAAIGAQVVANGFPFQTGAEQPVHSSSIRVVETGYYGAVADSGGLQEITLEAEGAAIDIGRIDVRPMPVAGEDSLTVYENSVGNYDSHLIVQNDAFTESVRLESAPLHAAFFELHEDGSFVYEPQKDYHGEDSFEYRAANGGGATLSSPATVTLYVAPVNSAPRFSGSGDVECDEDSGPQTTAGWATEIAAGPDDEAEQALDWILEVDNPALFAQQPVLDLQGNLAYTPAPNASGIALVTVRLHDNGGAENGGRDTSKPIVFKISVVPQNDAPMLRAIPDSAVTEGDVLRVTAKASEADYDTSVTYSLAQAPAGATIDPLSGQILWQPGSEDVGLLREFVVKANSSVDPALSCTTSFKAEVLERPKLPMLSRIENMATKPSGAVHFRVGQSLDHRYALLSGPKGAVLNSRTGMLYWKAPRVQAGGTYRFSVAAYNPWAPQNKAVQTFAVRVNPDAQLIAKAKSKPSNGTSGQAAMVFAKPSSSRAK